MEWVYDDGGRAAAGYKAVDVGDCVCRAVAIATGKTYSEVYAEIVEWGKKEKRQGRKPSHPRSGVLKPTARQYIISQGFEWVPTMFVGKGCKVHLREEELPSGVLICSLSKHVTAVIDGVIHDTYDPSRDGTRCVYGYYRRPA